MQSRGVSHLSVCLSVRLSVNFYTQVATSTTNMTRSPPNLHMMVPTWVYIQGVLKVKVKIKGHVIWTLCLFDKNRFFYHKHDCIATKLTQHGPHTGLQPGCAQGQGQGQRSRDTDTFVISRKSLLLPQTWLDRHQTCTWWSPHWPTVPSDILSLHALTSWNTVTLSFQYKCQAARCIVYIMEWATPSLTVWLWS